jgi:DNA processing protein
VTHRDVAHALALCALPQMGPVRLRALLGRWPPEEAWAAVRSGRALADARVRERLVHAPPALAEQWRSASVSIQPESLLRQAHAAGITVLLHGRPPYPSVLVDDPDPPLVLFARGDLGVIDGRRVAIVGTRNATEVGREVAFELAGGLADAGVRVVSGLARGIDGAAHRGALVADGAPPIGVVGSGLDIVYPRESARLWEEVTARGLLLSEAPPGAPPEPWRFPARNRIIAALAEVVVVVESRRRGGSMSTVEEALARDRTVLAVPGSVRAAASEGTNHLITEGAILVRDVGDVLVALGFARPASLDTATGALEAIDPADRPVAEALSRRACDLDGLIRATGLPLATVALSVTRLELKGVVARRAGWIEYVGGRR